MESTPDRARLRAAIATAGVLALAACSGKGDDPSPRATPASPAGAVVECRLPDVIGKPYDRARAAILDAGWRPVVHAAATPELAGFRKRGITEVVACDGADADACRMKFDNAQGDTLDVVTEGVAPAADDPNAAMPRVRTATPTCQA